MPTNLFPLLVVIHGRHLSAHIGTTGADYQVTRHVIAPERRVTTRLREGSLDVWVQSADGEGADPPYEVELHLRHARMVEFSESEAIFEGVEEVDFKLTGRTMRVVFTNHDSGWSGEEGDQ